ncbi:MAG: hypothetical protein CL930_02150 [Deltaproteobacteria bacterium]|nr:hypothetical protein [Deltaproteobacteria bacterium]
MSDARLEGTDVIATVSYSGGCAEHTWESCWSGAWLRSMPPRAVLNIGHNAHGDMCEAYLTEEIRIDITDIIDNALAGYGPEPFDVEVGGVRLNYVF